MKADHIQTICAPEGLAPRHGPIFLGEGKVKYEHDPHGTLWRVEACPPLASIAAEAKHAPGVHEPPFDVNLRGALHRHHRARVRCLAEWPTLVNDKASGQLFFHDMLPSSYFNWLKTIRALEDHARFYADISMHLKERLSQFTEGQFALWSCLYHDNDGSFSELLQSSPLLAWLAAQTIEYGHDASESKMALALCGGRRREILARTGFPSTEGVLRLLSKIDSPVLITRKTTHLLKRLLTRDQKTQRLLTRLPKVNLSVLSVLGNRELAPLTTPRLLAEIAVSGDETDEPHMPRLLRSILSSNRRLGVPSIPLKNLREVYKLDALLDDIALSHTLHLRDYRDFPAPPITGNGQIEPIRDSLQLCAEHCMLANDALSYCGQCVRGRLFAYRVLGPERATIFLAKYGKDWILFASIGHRGRRITSGTSKRLGEWLATNQDLGKKKRRCPEGNGMACKSLTDNPVPMKCNCLP